MHSSRMRTVRSSSRLCSRGGGEGGLLLRVCACSRGGGCLVLGGVPCPGGEGVTGPGGKGAGVPGLGGGGGVCMIQGGLLWGGGG